MNAPATAQQIGASAKRREDYRFPSGAGTDKSIPFAQIALSAYGPHNYPLDKLEPGLNENAFYVPTGARDVAMPATPHRVWQAVRQSIAANAAP